MKEFFHLRMRQHAIATANEIIPLNRIGMCDSVFFYTVRKIHSMSANCRQKLFHLHAVAPVNEVTPVSLNAIVYFSYTDKVI